MKEIMARKRDVLTWEESVLVAETRVTPGLYLIRRNGVWFRTEAKGYTSLLSDAGVFNAEKAKRYLCVEGVSVVPLESAIGDLEDECHGLALRLAALTELLKKVNSLKTE